MHDKGMDVFLEVLKVQYSDHKRVKVRARWWNLGYSGNPWCLDTRPTTIVLNRKDLSQWNNINHAVTRVRTKPGIPDGL